MEFEEKKKDIKIKLDETTQTEEIIKLDEDKTVLEEKKEEPNDEVRIYNYSGVC